MRSFKSNWCVLTPLMLARLAFKQNRKHPRCEGIKRPDGEKGRLYLNGHICVNNFKPFKLFNFVYSQKYSNRNSISEPMMHRRYLCEGCAVRIGFEPPSQEIVDLRDKLRRSYQSGMLYIPKAANQTVQVVA